MLGGRPGILGETLRERLWENRGQRDTGKGDGQKWGQVRGCSAQLSCTSVVCPEPQLQGQCVAVFSVCRASSPSQSQQHSPPRCTSVLTVIHTGSACAGNLAHSEAPSRSTVWLTIFPIVCGVELPSTSHCVLGSPWVSI